MFFILSKILSFVLNPMVWILFFLLWTVFAKKALRKKKLLIVSLLLFFFFGNSFILNEVAILFEKPYRTTKAEAKTTYGILLGGFVFFDKSNQNVHLAESGDRFFQALKLFNQGYFDTLVISGGSGSLTHPDQKEAGFVYEYFVQNKWDTNRLLLENESKNTFENANFTSAIIKNKKTPVYLITSGFHMSRAKGCFTKAGFEVIPHATHFISEPTRHYTVETFLIPNPKTLMKWELIIKEWIGIVVYKIRGYS